MTETVIFNDKIRSYSLQWTTEFMKKMFYIYDVGIVKEYKAETCSIKYTGLFISPSGISELDCATTKTDTAERSISIGRESLQVFFCTRELGVLLPPLGGSRDEKWHSL